MRQHIGSCENVCITMSLFPAFVAIYTRVQDLAWFFGVCEAMRHIGTFLWSAGWAKVLLCADPRKCWRSHYNYSHAGFYDMGGAQGRWNYINWYLFCKSQRRQCCCPYRKLKADAPEKCCPPCCAGPYVKKPVVVHVLVVVLLARAEDNRFAKF